MAKEIAIGKRAKISQAQQIMILSVLGASVALGIAASLMVHFIDKISFNAGVISAEDESIVSYSNAIKNIGVCPKPSGSTYSMDELKKCSPNTIDSSKVPGSLRANILENMAANESLNSVPKEATSECINPVTAKNYTYEELGKLYNEAGNNAEELATATSLIQSCSALRIIPDALPAFKNEEALLSSLNKIFIVSGWEPETLTPSGIAAVSPFGTNLNNFSVHLSVEADTQTTTRVLNNIERSIRDFDISRATIGWGSNNTLTLSAQATAYFMTPSTLKETTKTIKAGGNK